MISSIYIVHESGLLLLSWQRGSLENKNKEPVLVSGFISAIMSFAEEVIKGGKIKHLEFGSKHLVFKPEKEFTIVADVEEFSGFSSLVIFKKLEAISEEFKKVYGSRENISGVDVFKSFESVIEYILNREEDIGIEDAIGRYFDSEELFGFSLINASDGNILYSSMQNDVGNQRSILPSILFTAVNKVSQELKGGEVEQILVKSKNYWIVASKKDNYTLFCLFKRGADLTIVPSLVNDMFNLLTEKVIKSNKITK